MDSSAALRAEKRFLQLAREFLLTRPSRVQPPELNAAGVTPTWRLKWWVR